MAATVASARSAVRAAQRVHDGAASLLVATAVLSRCPEAPRALLAARRPAHVSASRPPGNGIAAVDRRDSTARSEAAGVVDSALRENAGQASSASVADDKENVTADPQLSVLGSGTSSTVLARLPSERSAKLLATRGTVIGKSPSVISRFRVEENVLAALRGSVVVYEELSCGSDVKSESGDVILAPRNPWESVAILTLDGTNEVQLRGGALLARTERVLLLGTGGRTSGMSLMSKIFSCKIVGRGSVAVMAAGGLHKVVLEENEQYMVDPRRMVAWNLRPCPAPATSQIQQLDLPTAVPTKSEPGRAEPSGEEARFSNSAGSDGSFAKTPGDANAKTTAMMYADAVSLRLAYVGKYLWVMVSRWMREVALGRPDYVKLTGPGVVYLSGRRGITGLQRIGVDMDWVARNLPTLPARPPPIRPSATQKGARTSDPVFLDKPVHPDVLFSNNPLPANAALDSKSPLSASGGIGGPKLTTKAVETPPVNVLPQRD